MTVLKAVSDKLKPVHFKTRSEMKSGQLYFFISKKVLNYENDIKIFYNDKYSGFNERL